MSESLVNAFNTGKHCQVVIRHPLAPGGRLDLPLVTDFDAKPNWHDISGNHLDGYTRTQHVITNFMLSFSVDRSSNLMDNFLNALVRAYRLLGVVPDGTIYQYITELDGSQTTNEYSGVSFKPDDLGSWKKESAVNQKLTATAMDFRRVS